MNDLLLDLHIKHIDRGARELARADLPLEQEIQLGERAAGGFREAKVDVDDAEEAGDAPEEAGVVAPVPGGGVEHVGGYHAAEYANDIAVDFC